MLRKRIDVRNVHFRHLEATRTAYAVTAVNSMGITAYTVLGTQKEITENVFVAEIKTTRKTQIFAYRVHGRGEKLNDLSKFNTLVRISRLLLSVGHHPNCSCKEPLIYDEEANGCFQCPIESTGTYPNCSCVSGIFGKANRACIECPIDSKGCFFPYKINKYTD